MAINDFDSCREMMDRRYGHALRLSAEYTKQMLVSAIEVIASASGVQPNAVQIAAKVSGLMTSPEVVAAAVTAQAQVFAALSAANDAASVEQLASALGDIERAVRSLDRS